MMKGKVIIDFEYDEINEECNWNLIQEGKDILDNENLSYLLKHILAETLSDNY